jgi:hypothetical protein
VPALSSAERQRRKFTPDDIRVLFIGESPPAGAAFFYFANSNLYDATREAFEQAIPALRREPDFLGAFRRLGCYLEDLSPVPVNHLDLGDPQQRRERRALRREGINSLARRMRAWTPRVVAVVMLDMLRTGDLQQLLSEARYGEVERADLPFPGRHRGRYVEELTDHVGSWRRRGIVSPI